MTAHTLVVKNANDGLYEGLKYLTKKGEVESSRNGPVLVAPGPVITQYYHPYERVVFSAIRDANPFFHLYESIWMLAGMQDSASVAKYARTMDSFAENGILNGAYGYRWLFHFGHNQIETALVELRRNPDSRRAVIGMWDPSQDPISVLRGSKDVPCNTHVYVDLRNGKLNMTVCNRSNDIVWGCYGANYVHMGVLQEFMAHALGVSVGVYTQISNNYHLYLNRPDVERLLQPTHGGLRYNVLYHLDDRYTTLPTPTHVPITFKSQAEFLYDCVYLAENPLNAKAIHGPFLEQVFGPMMKAHAAYKTGNFKEARAELRFCTAQDWCTAGMEWLQRRELARAEAT